MDKRADRWFYFNWARKSFSSRELATTPEDAAEKSLVKWELICGGFNSDGDVPNCGLCNLYLNDVNPCKGCPIKQKTGRDSCAETPYQDWHHATAFNKLFHAQRELHFLRNLFAKEGENMTPTHELLFINPELRAGLNLTVRRGEKWYRKAKVGDIVDIQRTGYSGHSPIVRGQIVGIAFIPFLLVPEVWLYHEHDKTCSNLLGLKTAMERAYPDFRTEEWVTVILFNL